MTSKRPVCEIKMYDYADAAEINLPDIPIKTYSEFSKTTGFFDNSKELKLPYIATSPNLLSGFININSYDCYEIDSNYICSSQLFYIIQGKGYITINGFENIDYSTGDLITCSFYESQHIISKTPTHIYWVSDYPLLKYMGVKPAKEIIPPIIYKKEVMETFLHEVCTSKNAHLKNRNGILLANSITEELGTKTVSHILWALLNKIKPNSVQKPHRHNSVALDYCIYAGKNVYTAMGKELNHDGTIKNPVIVEWKTGHAFTTPPGWWHSHVNNGTEEAIVLPIQDAGLYTYQRTLDIQFYN
jgi:gentisate 1,2-dioxygenase